MSKWTLTVAIPVTAPRWDDVPDADRAVFVDVMTRMRDDLARRARDDHGRTDIGDRSVAMFDAALARLAEPAQSSAATTSSPCARCGHAWHEHVDRDSDNACQANGCPCARWYGGAQSSTPAAPAQPSAAERWRAVSRSAAAMDLVARLTEEAAAYKASGEQHEADALVRLMLLALAREAEGGR